MASHRVLAGFMIWVALSAGCSSSGGGGGASATPPPPATMVVRVYRDPPTNSMLWGEGFVLVGSDGKPTDVKHGLWKTYFEEHVSGVKDRLESEKVYEFGNWNSEASWIIYNADSSIRDTMYDGKF